MQIMQTLFYCNGACMPDVNVHTNATETEIDPNPSHAFSLANTFSFPKRI